MLLASAWEPRLGDGLSPSERLVTALAADILDGVVESGGRLPAHRDLAYRLDMGVGAVTRAYAVLERRGLIRTVKGRGTFVAAVKARSGPAINLSNNAPPAMLTERLLAHTLRQLSHKIDPATLTSYPPPAGHDEHRRLMASWFRDLGVEAEAERIVLCSGAQQALSLALSLLCPAGSTMITEEFTYFGAIGMARARGIDLSAVRMDGHGMIPDDLDRALTGKAWQTRPVVYVTPTMQTPTTATMPLERRKAIIAVCRKHDAWIIEDDVYALAASPELPPLVNLAPERTFYANSLSKTLSPGLRLGALMTPEAFIPAAETIIRSSGLFVSGLSCAVMGEWLADGTAYSLRASIRDEARRRRGMALAILGDGVKEPDHDGFHLWLPMSRAAADQFSLAAKALGITVTPSDTVIVDTNTQTSGIRLCLGAPSLADLSTALIGVAGLIGSVGEQHIEGGEA